MHITRKLCLIAAAVVAAGAFASPSFAQDCGGYGWGGGWPYNFQSGIYGRTNAYVLPYFSLHPPVYYSHVVPRAYGFSPFAAPPGMIPAENTLAPVSETIENPHFKPKADSENGSDAAPEAKKTSDRSTTARREIVNPHFRLANVPASSVRK